MLGKTAQLLMDKSTINQR